MVLLACCAAASVDGRASAYVRTTTELGKPMEWPQRCLAITVYTGNPPSRLTGDVLLEAARLAAAAWTHDSIACSALEIAVDTSEEAQADAAYDGHNRLMFNRTWCRDGKPGDPLECYEPSALAITSVFAKKSTGEILDADIELNAKQPGGFTWADLVAGGAAVAGSQDVQNTLTHEFGHFVGLDHNCYSPSQRGRPVDNTGRPAPDCGSAATPEILRATMYPSVRRGDIERRTLENDDQQAVCAVYPTESPPACHPSGSGGGGCRVDDAGNPTRGATTMVPLALLVGVGALAVCRRHRARARSVRARRSSCGGALSPS